MCVCVCVCVRVCVLCMCVISTVKSHIPELLPYVHSAYSSPSILLWNGAQVLSSEGIQQGDPLGPMLFCLGIHNLVCSLSSEFKVFYLDGTIGGSLQDIEADLKIIEDHGRDLGLFLNVDKSEVVSHSQSTVNPLTSAFPGLQYVHAARAILLGSPLGSEALCVCFEEQLHQLKVIGECLCYLQMHDTITFYVIPSLSQSSCTLYAPHLPTPHLLWSLGTTS